ncbi:MAG: hypothetical protein GDA46_01100 [Bdellovibrionales bacterium]|nr:hypothetical protein [Bdellovibrionales bacterium]
MGQFSLSLKKTLNSKGQILIEFLLGFIFMFSFLWFLQILYFHSQESIQKERLSSKEIKKAPWFQKKEVP